MMQAPLQAREDSMAAVMHHTLHMPASMTRTARRIEHLVEAVLFSLLPPLVFGLLIVGGLLIAMAVAAVL